MKIWVISGERRKVGKTYLANQLAEHLDEAMVVKIGHHPPRVGKPSLYFTSITQFHAFRQQLEDVAHLIVESNRLSLERFGDLRIYLPSPADWENRRADGPALEESAQIVLSPAAKQADWEESLDSVLPDRNRIAPLLGVLQQQRDYLVKLPPS